MGLIDIMHKADLVGGVEAAKGKCNRLTLAGGERQGGKGQEGKSREGRDRRGKAGREGKGRRGKEASLAGLASWLAEGL